MGRFSCPYYSTLWASTAEGFRMRCYYGRRDNSIYGISSGPEDDYLPVPIDDAGIPKPLFEGGLFSPKDLIPVFPLQEIPPQEVEANADSNKVDLVDFLATPEDPLVIIITSDDDEEDAKKEIEDVEDDPEEILFGNDDQDVFSDVTTQQIVQT